MSDHVMQLPGDARALGRGGDLGLRVPLAFGPDGAFLQRGGVGPPVAHRVAEHPRAHRGQQVEQAGHEEELGVVGLVPARVVPYGHGQEQHHARRQRRQRDPPWPFGRDGVEQDQDGGIGERGLQRAAGERRPDADDHLSGADGERGDVGRHREAPTHRHRAGQRQAGRQDGGVDEVGVGGARQQDDRQRPVYEPRMTTQPGVEPFHRSRVTSLVLRRLLTHRGG